MRTRTIILSSTGLLAAAAIGYGAAVVLGDPDASVDAIPVGGFTTPTTTAGTAAATAPDASVPVASPVEGLEQLVGALRAGDDPDDWQVAGVDVDFGPDGWLATAPALGDFDGDGTTEPVLEELSGLEGREVTLGVRYEDDDEDDSDDARERDDADVYTIDGATFRDPTGGPPPWQTTGDGPAPDRQAIAAAAAAAVGDGARAGEVERENEDGWQGWEVEVRGNDGNEYQVLLDSDGSVVDVRIDD
jgi:uncharacterized membrane protein YkoI